MSCEDPPKSTPVQAQVSKPAVKKAAPVKVTVNEVDTQQTVFTKASKNIRSVMQTLNTAQKSIGSDRMFDATRRQLAKLSELLEIRAFVLDALAEAMTVATGGYKTAQAQSVKVVTECKAHKTDFYGNPVHVSAATGAAGGVVGSVGAANPSVTAEAPGASVTAEVPGASASVESTNAQTVNVTQNVTHVVNNYGVSAPSAGSAPEMASAPAPTAEPASGGIPVGAAVAGMAGAAVLGGTAYGLAEMTKEKRQEKKQKKENKQLDDQLAAAKQKLQDIEEEENRLRAQISEEAEDSDEES